MKITIPSLVGLVSLCLVAAGCVTQPRSTKSPSSVGSLGLTGPSCAEQPGNEWTPYFVAQPEDLTLEVGQNGGTKLKVKAKANGDRVVEYRWFKGSQMLLETGDTLSLKPVTLDTAGFYVCQAIMMAEGVEYTACSRLAEVQVFGKGPGISPPLLSSTLTNITTISTVTVSAPPRIGTVSGNGCPGAYVARAGFRDSNGNLTWTPPSGATGFTITDVTANRPAGYASSVAAAVGLTQVACGPNSTSYRMTSASQKFTLTIYVNSLGSTPPSSWTGPILLRVDWTR